MFLKSGTPSSSHRDSYKYLFQNDRYPRRKGKAYKTFMIPLFTLGLEENGIYLQKKIKHFFFHKLSHFRRIMSHFEIRY